MAVGLHLLTVSNDAMELVVSRQSSVVSRQSSVVRLNMTKDLVFSFHLKCIEPLNPDQTAIELSEAVEADCRFIEPSCSDWYGGSRMLPLKLHLAKCIVGVLSPIRELFSSQLSPCFREVHPLDSFFGSLFIRFDGWHSGLRQI